MADEKVHFTFADNFAPYFLLIFSPIFVITCLLGIFYTYLTTEVRVFSLYSVTISKTEHSKLPSRFLYCSFPPSLQLGTLAADCNRKWGVFPFKFPWRHHICVTKCLYSVDTIYLKICVKPLPMNAKRPLPVAICRSKMPFRPRSNAVLHMSRT